MTNKEDLDLYMDNKNKRERELADATDKVFETETEVMHAEATLKRAKFRHAAAKDVLKAIIRGEY